MRRQPRPPKLALSGHFDAITRDRMLPRTDDLGTVAALHGDRQVLAGSMRSTAEPDDRNRCKAVSSRSKLVR